MKTESRNIIVLFALAIIASGCASTTQTSDTTSSNNPISVNNFEGIPDPVPSGQTMNLNLELENTGDQDAEEVAARVFGPSFGQGERVWSSSDGSDITGIDERTHDLGQSLRAPSEDNPSIPKRISWNMRAPNLERNREVDYTFYSKIFYEYENRGQTQFKLVSDERFREQGYTQGEASVENTDGPIQLDVRGTTPKVYYDGDEKLSSEICITVENKGEGTAFIGGKVDSGREYNVDDERENKVNLEIEDVGKIDFSPVEEGNEVNLVGGNEGFKCYNMDAGDVGNLNAEENINAQITAEYNYMKETSTTVTVEGRGLDSPESKTYEWLGDKGVTWDSAVDDTGSEDVDDVCSYLENQVEKGEIPQSSFEDNCDLD